MHLRCSCSSDCVHCTSTLFSKHFLCSVARAAPEGVSPPAVEWAQPTALGLVWPDPLRPNGPLTQFALYSYNGSSSTGTGSGVLLFSGLAHWANVSGLAPFTAYTFWLLACTAGSCSASAPAQLWSGQLPPNASAVPAPTLVALSSTSSALLVWTAPVVAHAVLSWYRLYVVPQARVYEDAGSTSAPAYESFYEEANVTGSSNIATSAQPFLAYSASADSGTVLYICTSKLYTLVNLSPTVIIVSGT